MKGEGGLRNELRGIRARLGLSQQELAGAARVTRQTISGIEAGLYAPSATVALRIARALGCRVEDLFWLEEELPVVTAHCAGEAWGAGTPVVLGQVAGRWVAEPLRAERAFRTETVPADGVLAPPDASRHSTERPGGEIQVRLLDDPEQLARTVLLAGCTPALSLWARAAERWHPGLRVHWSFANSMAALRRLAEGEVHAAGVHLWTGAEGEFNEPFVRRLLPGRAVTLVNLGVWEEGLLVAPGNPRQLRRGADLAQPDLRIVNREPGAGSRLLVVRLVEADGVPSTAVAGFDRLVPDHLDVARAVAAGEADAGVSTAAVAAAYGLGFVPCRAVRYDLAVLKEYLDLEPLRQLLGTLHHRRVRSQLRMLAGYDTAHTGDVVAETTARVA